MIEERGCFMILYHASDVLGIEELRPTVSNHKNAYIYLCDKQEDICVYLVNPIRKFCLDNNIKVEEQYRRWALRTLDKERNVPLLLEWWPNAFEDVYKGVPACFYCVEKDDDCIPLEDNSFCNVSYYISSKPMKVKEVIEIPDVWEYFKKLESEGKIVLCKYEDLSESRRKWIMDTALRNYDNAVKNNHQYRIRFYEEKLGVTKSMLDEYRSSKSDEMPSQSQNINKKEKTK